MKLLSYMLKHYCACFLSRKAKLFFPSNSPSQFRNIEDMRSLPYFFILWFPFTLLQWPHVRQRVCLLQECETHLDDPNHALLQSVT